MRFTLPLLFLFINLVSISQNISLNRIKTINDNLNVENIIKYNESEIFKQVFPNQKGKVNFNTPLSHTMPRSLYLDSTSFRNEITKKRLVLRVEPAHSATSFNSKSSIYNHLKIIPNQHSVIFFNNENLVLGTLTNFVFPFGYHDVRKDKLSNRKERIYMRRRIHAYEKIIKYCPEVIMFSVGFDIKHQTILFIKNDNIYVYMCKKRKKYELNEYIKKYLKPCIIRKLASNYYSYGDYHYRLKEMLKCSGKSDK